MPDSIKQALLKEIEQTENEKLLHAVYTILTCGKNESDLELTEEQLQMLKEREEAYLSGKSKAYTWDEVKLRLKPRTNV